MIHKLKILPEYFVPVKNRQKNFEIRKNDRHFEIGDVVKLREWEQKTGYTNRVVTVVITYITNYEQQEGYVVFGFVAIDYKN